MKVASRLAEARGGNFPMRHQEIKVCWQKGKLRALVKQKSPDKHLFWVFETRRKTSLAKNLP